MMSKTTGRRTAGVNKKFLYWRGVFQNLTVTYLQFLKFYFTSSLFLLPVLIQCCNLPSGLGWGIWRGNT